MSISGSSSGRTLQGGQGHLGVADVIFVCVYACVRACVRVVFDIQSATGTE